MSLDLHTISLIDGAQPVRKDRIFFGIYPAVANAAGGGAGQAVTTAVALKLPPSYCVVVQPTQDVTWYITGKTAAGFNVVMTPRLAATTLAAGTFDVLIYA